MADHTSNELQPGTVDKSEDSIGGQRADGGPTDLIKPTLQFPELPPEILCEIIKKYFEDEDSYPLWNPDYPSAKALRKGHTFRIVRDSFYRPAGSGLNRGDLLSVNRMFLAEGRKALYSRCLKFHSDASAREFIAFLGHIGEEARREIKTLQFGSLEAFGKDIPHHLELPNLETVHLYESEDMPHCFRRLLEFMSRGKFKLLSIGCHAYFHYSVVKRMRDYLFEIGWQCEMKLNVSAGISDDDSDEEKEDSSGEDEDHEDLSEEAGDLNHEIEGLTEEDEDLDEEPMIKVTSVTRVPASRIPNGRDSFFW